MTTLTLNLIGAGRVGLTLAQLWQQAGGPLRVQAVCNPGAGRREQARRVLGTQVQLCATPAELPPADAWLLAVPDGQIAPVATALAALPQCGAPAVAWHCSGFQNAGLLAPLRALGWAVASVHPALSFAELASACEQFPGTVCALEGDAPALALARQAFGAIGGDCFELAAADKPLYHAAAVFASNFLPVLVAAAQELWQRSGVPPERVPALSQRFVRLAASNVLTLGPAAALTGPAARGDVAVVQAQTAALAEADALLGQSYAALSALAARLAQHGQVLPAATAQNQYADRR